MPLFTQRQCLKVTFSWSFRYSAKDAVLLLRSWSNLYTPFSKYKVSWFCFFYFNSQLVTESAYVWDIFFLKFQVLRKGSSFIASFEEHHAYSSFKMYSVLILVFLKFICLKLIQRVSAKVNFSSGFWCTTKEAVLLLRSWSTLYITFSICKAFWFCFFSFNLPRLSETAYVKIIYSKNFRFSAKEAVLLPLSWNTLHVAISKYIVPWF